MARPSLPDPEEEIPTRQDVARVISNLSRALRKQSEAMIQATEELKKARSAFEHATYELDKTHRQIEVAQARAIRAREETAILTELGVPSEVSEFLIKALYSEGETTTSIVKAVNRLERRGITKIGQFLVLDENDLLEIHQFGVGGLYLIHQALEKRGWLYYAKSYPAPKWIRSEWKRRGLI